MPEFLQRYVVTAGLAHRITVHPQHCGFGECGGHLFFQLLSPRAKEPNCGAFTRGTFFGSRNTVIATVADGFLAITVPRQCNVAVRTFDARSATAAPDGGRVASKIQKQDHLALVLQRPVDGGPQSSPNGSAFGNLRIVAGVHNDHGRQRQIVNSVRHRQQRVLSASGAQPRFQRRSRRSQQQRYFFLAAAVAGDFSSVITRHRVLFESWFVLLVNNNQAEIRCRRKDSTAGTHDDFDRTASNLLPLPVSFRVRHVAV